MDSDGKRGYAGEDPRGVNDVGREAADGEDAKDRGTGTKGVYRIEDVARALGVSNATVSRAMSGKGRISPATRKRILDYISEHNYRPNPAAISLAKSRTYNIGLILPGDGKAADSPFFQLCMLGICETAAKHDYDVLLVFDSDHSVEPIRRIIDNRKTDGIIATRSEIDSPIISLMKEKEAPFVLIGATDDPGIVSVDNNNRAACRDLVSLIISRGVRKIALLCGDSRQQVTASRYAGFADACLAAGLDPSRQLVFPDAENITRTAECVDAALSEGAECLICMDDMLCSIAVDRLKEKHVAIPADIKVACFYDSPLLAAGSPSVTGLRFDATELGRRACVELLRQIDGSPGQSAVLTGYQMMLRETTE